MGFSLYGVKTIDGVRAEPIPAPVPGAAPLWPDHVGANNLIAESFENSPINFSWFAVGATTHSIIAGTLPQTMAYSSAGEFSGTTPNVVQPGAITRINLTLRATNQFGSTDQDVGIDIIG